jgi:hypothetical protein
MLLRRSAYEAIGGIATEYFMYFEDVDLCWRLRLAGWEVTFQPSALVTHDYAFAKGNRKWFLLERNRLRSLLVCYRCSTIALLGPILLAVEVAIAIAARADGWWPQKRDAYRAVWHERHEIAERRRDVQRLRTVSDQEIVGRFTGRFDTRAFGARALGPLTLPIELLRRAAIRILS